MKGKLGLNPWLSIWVHPRKTIRALVEYNTNYRLVTFCVVYGFQYILQILQYLSLVEGTSLLFVILLALIFSIPMGYIVFNVLSAFYFWVGKLIKGKGSFKQIRAATYWSTVPMVVTCLVWIVLMVLHGNSFFVVGYEAKLVGTAAAISIGLGIIQLVIAIWGLIILLHALGEVQGFSVWMTLLNLVLAGLAIFILLFLIVWGVSSVIHVT
ncbi:MAG: YIP1 family protein [Candidatus Neptunochlamydia sp.]|nr:YIP1 family protein [Candidatus Neptunochlamydia sp.]